MKFFQLLALVSASILLGTSCSTTPKITSQFSNREVSTRQSANLTSQMDHVDRESVDGISFFVTHDERNLYIMVDFISARLFQLAREFGFTLYLDSEDKFKRSFGITYPTGIFYELGDYPEARRGYIQEPEWSNFPENEAIKETAEQNITRRALIIQRSGKREDMRPVPIPLGQLDAQNLRLHIDESGRNGRISFTIPLEIQSTSQFSPDVKPGETLDLGFEIDPIRLLDMESDSPPPMTTSSRNRNQTRTQTSEEEERNELLAQLMRRLGEPYREWVKVELEPSE